jgi:glutamate formiminotransferase/formiminotetrahydrofolate cyclodeaminase
MDFKIDTDFLNAVASAEPTPGGGSAAAYVGALAAALVVMAARTTVGKKKYADVEARMTEIIAEAETCRAELQACVHLDAQSFDAVLDAQQMPKDGVEQVAVEKAILGATEVPLTVAKMSLQVLELAIEVTATGNLNTLSDAASGAAFANGAIFAAGLNVKVNAKGFDNLEAASRLETQILGIQTRAAELMTQLNTVIQERGGID